MGKASSGSMVIKGGGGFAWLIVWVVFACMVFDEECCCDCEVYGIRGLS